MASPQLTVKCQIVGHSSPRWRSAPTDTQRVLSNENLSRQRADALMSEFRTALSRSLGQYQLKFIENRSYAEELQPDQSMVIEAESMGQRQSLRDAGGDRTNDDAKYRRCDLLVKIARSTQDEMPTKIVEKSLRSSRSHFWYASTGVGASVDVGFGVGFMRIKLRNNLGDSAEGSVASAGGGLGLKYAFSAINWSDEASFYTSRDVGFGDFHGVRVRYTNAGLVIGIGYARSYLTFYGMGPDASSQHVGGWTTGLQASLDISEGILVLDTVPPDFAIERIDMTRWNMIRSDWITQQNASVYYDNNQWNLLPRQRNDVATFAAKVAQDIRTN